MKKEDCFELGKVLRPVGLAGELSLMFDADEPEAYSEIEMLFLEENGRPVPYFIESLKFLPGRIHVKFEGIDSQDDAARLKGFQILLPLTMLPDPGDQFYVHELVGMLAKDEKVGPLGIVKYIYELPVQELMAVDYLGNEVLIPVNREIILRLDREQNEVHLRLPDGLLDVYSS